ncbi:YicC/YloC family endoribonuclease [Vogesella sp. XCS3]|uniref:YicC/YloC family endoribonuclease n=1 Tax=Vogesella sp. XCS3 TaxID=2877939 RepID=UPI0003769C73|nr:YicC/YloC family endoribonuclease [Vogesella sp. XCS3]MBP7579472.1 YicC family protein [Vogesella sp.]UDM15643.1 YicC family protein [Vogesella sp. XCS3]
MILSMTGFASTTREFPGGLLSIELRAVNHRYLDVQMRLPEELRIIEPQLRELIGGRVTRGKVECRIGLNQTDSDTPQLELNRDTVQRLLAVSAEVRELAPQVRDLGMGELLRWPGVLKSNSLAPEVLHQLCLEGLNAVLGDFRDTRAREGSKLAQVLLDRISGMDHIIAEVKPRLPVILEAYRTRLAARLQEALGNVDDDRIKQEFALFAQKIDVDEELERLTTHLAEVRRILKTGGQVGKRLDFLMQELNREANTLGSKSVSTETTQASVELKVLIEQMREQIQNVE